MKRKYTKFLFSNILASAILFVQCFAQNPTELAQNFNVFLKNGAKLITNETEGPVALGGDLTLAGDYRVANSDAGTFKVGSLPIGLLVGGKIVYESGNGLTVNQSAYVKIANCSGSTVWYRDNNNAFANIQITSGAYNTTPRINIQKNAKDFSVSASVNPVCDKAYIDFEKAFATMQTYATNLSKTTNNAAFYDPNEKKKFATITEALKYTGGNQLKLYVQDGLNYINVTGDELNSLTNGLTYIGNEPDDSHIVIFNVTTPKAFKWLVSNQAGIGKKSLSYVMFNFPNATTLNIAGNSTIEGTVFAPFADIVKKENQSNIEGQIIALSYEHAGGENHYYVFKGSSKDCGDGQAANSISYTSASFCANGIAKVTLSGTSGGQYTAVPSGLSINAVSGDINLTDSKAGSYQISYTIGNATATTNVTVNALPTVAAISGNNSICKNNTTLLSTTPTGGTWLSASTGVATINSGGTVSAINTGTSVITYSYTNASGCNTTVSTLVTVKSTSSSTTTASICSGGSYLFNGVSYTAGGTYSARLTNAAGCDSIATLVLSVKSTSSSTTTPSICSGGSYLFNGVSYTAGGTYSARLTNAAGCDSIATLVLSVRSTSSSTTTASICSGGSYLFNGVSYTAGGTYSTRLTNAVGCDSIATLVLTIKSLPDASFAVANGLTVQQLANNQFELVPTVPNYQSYTWLLGKENGIRASTIKKVFSKSGIYDIALIAEQNGCIDTTVQTIVVTEPKVAEVNVPTCESGLKSQVILKKATLPLSSTDWKDGYTKNVSIEKFDTALGVLQAVKLISNVQLNTRFKVEITGNMPNGVTQRVYSKTDGTMYLAGDGFSFGLQVPSVIDTFNATKYDGVTDFAGTSGKDFGWEISTKRDSVMLLASLQDVSAYKGSGNALITASTNTKDSSFFPTGNTRSDKSTLMGVDLTVEYYYCPKTSDYVSSGNTGGVESKSLGDAITRRVVNKARNNENGAINYANVPMWNVSTKQKTTNGILGGFEKGNLDISSSTNLASLMPAHLSGYTGLLTSPTDLTGITNANEVISIDFVYNNKAKAVAFATKTSGEVYSHTKPICDRLKGASLLSIQEITILGTPLIQYTLQSANGNVEYAVSFSIGTQQGRNSYTIQSNWLTKDFVADENMYNFQLWAVSPQLVADMAQQVLVKLKGYAPVEVLQSATNGKVPATYIESGKREAGTLTLVINNKTSKTTGHFILNEKVNELATVTARSVAFNIIPNGKTIVSLPVNDSYESDIWMYVNGEVMDLVYMGDGSWSVNYDQSSTRLNKFVVSNNAHRNYTNEFPIFRNVQVEATTSNYVSVYKLLSGGGVAKDVSAYKTLKFTAAGGNKLRITLIKNSIKEWNKQYTVLIPLDVYEKQYYIQLEKFVSAGTANTIDASDITSIVFSIEVASNNTYINNTIANIGFTKDDAELLNNLSSKELSLYPNPVTTRFTCSYYSSQEEVLTLKLIELATGRVAITKTVTTAKGKNKVDVDVNNMAVGNGLYIVSVEGPNTQYKRKPITILK